jgi:hypothetical protein
MVVDVGSVRGSRQLPVEQHAKPRGSPSRRYHDQVQVAGVEAVGDLPTWLVQHRGLRVHRPVTGKGPVVERQPCGGGIRVRHVQDRTVTSDRKNSTAATTAAVMYASVLLPGYAAGKRPVAGKRSRGTGRGADTRCQTPASPCCAFWAPSEARDTFDVKGCWDPERDDPSIFAPGAVGA